MCYGLIELEINNLDKPPQAKMENAFQEDFSNVKVTKDSNEATQMGAQAFTQGDKIHFAPGNYQPHSTEGQELIGHELTHVVQQKQGRVKATTQAKGAPVNNDPALENEADVMGKKAAGGEQAVVQKQSKNGEVQRQEEEVIDDPGKIDITLQDWFKTIKIPGVKYKGAIYRIFINDKGEKRPINVRHIVVPTKNQWVEILKHGDSLYHSHIIGFLKASMDESWSSRQSEEVLEADMQGTGVIRTDYFHVVDGSSISDSEQADFLEALYSIGQNEQTVQMPKDTIFTSPGTSWTYLYGYLRNFIDKNQQLIIDRVITEREIFDSEGLQYVAGLGTDVRQSLAPSMIANAFTTAVGTAKKFIAELAVHFDESSSNSFDSSWATTVRKCGIIIDEAIKGQQIEAKAITARSQAVFDTVWDSIPFGKLIDKIANPIYKRFAQIAAERAKTALRTQLSGANFGNLSTLNEYGQAFNNIVEALKDPVEEQAEIAGLTKVQKDFMNVKIELIKEALK